MNFRTSVDPELQIKAALVRLREDLVGPGHDLHWPRGVVGAFDQRQQVLYGYPEIASYWLRWASARSDVGDRSGNSVLTWLIRQYAQNQGWPTRVPAHRGDVSAEYADASYLFDHVMLWDGLQRWGRVRHSADALGLAQLAWERAQAFVVDGRVLAATGAISQRWSGQAGPFLLKVCARIQGRDGILADACAQARADWIAAALEQPHREAHPQLYAIEGLHELGLIAEARRAFGELLRAHGGVARVREQIDGGPRRSDVLAQLLRLGCVLGQANKADPDWSALASELAARVDARGRLPFAESANGTRPSWAALFCEQALSLWLDRADDRSLLV
ncbi:MAG: hypothetical protein AB7E72_05530 [Lysobacterales bacterium]